MVKHGRGLDGRGLSDWPVRVHYDSSKNCPCSLVFETTGAICDTGENVTEAEFEAVLILPDSEDSEGLNWAEIFERIAVWLAFRE